MAEFQIDMVVKLEGALVFTLWLPSEDQKIEIEEDGVTVQLWIDPENLGYPFPQKPFEKHINIQVEALRARAKITASDELRRYIEGRTYTAADQPAEEEVANQYEALGRKVFSVLHRRIERLIDYAYSVKGQYWALGPRGDEDNPGQYFIKSDASVSFGNEKRYPFSPDRVITVTITESDERSYISESDWDALRRFVIGEQRAPLVRHLLSRARDLATKDYRRTAIIEAVSALEVALNDFARKYKPSDLHRQLASRLEGASITNLIKKLGFRGTFSVALPLLFSESQLENKILNHCRKAIEARNNLIHNSQRDVNEKDLLPWLASIETCCDRFEQLCGST